MDVLDTGVMHPAFPPGIRVQSAFEHGPEDGGADLGPVELLAALFNQQFSDFFVHPGDFDVFIGKKTAVHIGEGQQFRGLIRIPVFRFLVQDTE